MGLRESKERLRLSGQQIQWLPQRVYISMMLFVGKVGGESCNFIVF